MYLVFDIETTGLVKCERFNVYPDYKDLEKYDSARIVQIAWVILNAQYKTIEKKNYIIKRDDFSIDNVDFHGISNEMSDIQGTEFDIVMLDFLRALQKCQLIVAHNILFDYNVLASSLYRYRLYYVFCKFSSKKRFCTSFESMSILKLVMPYPCNYYKFPSLHDLYFYYFGKKIENAHNALVDTIVCAQCFVALIQDERYQYRHIYTTQAMFC